MKTHPDNICTNCHKKLDDATSTSKERRFPMEGDICICVYCGQVGEYDADLKINPLREDQVLKLFKEYPYLEQQILKIQSVFTFLRESKLTSNDN